MANRLTRALPALAPLFGLLLSLGLSSCLTDAGPCQDYCDYICSCHAGEPEYDCQQCRTTYSDADPQLQDECQTELDDLQSTDNENGTGCVSGEDTAAG